MGEVHAVCQFLSGSSVDAKAGMRRRQSYSTVLRNLEWCPSGAHATSGSVPCAG